MNLGIDGKRALVTGSTAGIGLATARLLAAENAAVVVNGRTEARVGTAVRAIQDAVPRANVRGVAADLGTAAGCAAVVAAQAVRDAGRGGVDDRLRLQRPRLGDERSGPARRRRRRALHRMSGIALR